MSETNNDPAQAVNARVPSVGMPERKQMTLSSSTQQRGVVVVMDGSSAHHTPGVARPQQDHMRRGSLYPDGTREGQARGLVQEEYQ